MDTPENISPQERLTRSHRTAEFNLARVRIPLYGLPITWAGTRRLGNTCYEQGVQRHPDGTATAEIHETVELLHEASVAAMPSGLAPVLGAESSDVFGDISTDTLLSCLCQFDAARRRKRRRAGLAETSDAFDPTRDSHELSEVVLNVDGALTAFACVTYGGLAVARWPGHRVSITLRADGWTDLRGLELVQVTDPSEYLDGRRLALEAASGYRLR